MKVQKQIKIIIILIFILKDFFDYIYSFKGEIKMFNKMKEKLGKIIEDTCDLVKIYLLNKIGLENKAKEELNKMIIKEEE